MSKESPPVMVLCYGPDQLAICKQRKCQSFHFITQLKVYIHHAFLYTIKSPTKKSLIPSRLNINIAERASEGAHRIPNRNVLSIHPQGNDILQSSIPARGAVVQGDGSCNGVL